MIEKAPVNKDMGNDMSPPKTEFHFPGSGIYHPLTVLARTRDEAEKLWLNLRKLVEQKQEPKVEPPTDNQN